MPPARAYRSRVVDAELDALCADVAAIALEGAKGVGKTATAERRCATVQHLDDPAQRQIFQAEPARLLTAAPPVLIDEWQHVPQVWDLVRRAVDAGTQPGTFLLTGSMLPLRASTHSGAARIVRVHMRPMSVAERIDEPPTVSLAGLLAGDRGPLSGESAHGLEWYTSEILASGFPGLRGTTGRALRAQLGGYIDRVVDHDFLELGQRVRNPATLRRWMTAYAAASSSTTSFEKIRDAASGDQRDKPAKSTVIPYRDALEHLWLLEPVEAWSPTRNRLARLSSAPKHQLVDPALAAHLLGVDERALLSGDGRSLQPRDGTLLGSLFESLATLSVRVYAQAAELRVRHLRLHSGEREVDLILEALDGRVLAIEVKLDATVDDADVRHLHWLERELGDDLIDKVVITTGSQAFRRRDGVAVVPLALLGP